LAVYGPIWDDVALTNAVGSGEQEQEQVAEAGAVAGSAIFKKPMEAECFGRMFYLIHNLIYFNACILKKDIENAELNTKNMKT
jgi:hypothetical protein